MGARAVAPPPNGNGNGNGLCGWLLILPLFKAGQLVQQWVASSSLLAGAGWWAARVIERENSEPFWMRVF